MDFPDRRKRFGYSPPPLMEMSQANVNQDLSSAIMSQQQQLQQQAGSGDAQEAGTTQSAEQPPMAEMSELDKFGLAGLLSMIHSDSPDVASLAVGQDLMTLGLDLNQPE